MSTGASDHERNAVSVASECLLSLSTVPAAAKAADGLCHSLQGSLLPGRSGAWEPKAESLAVAPLASSHFATYVASQKHSSPTGDVLSPRDAPTTQPAGAVLLQPTHVAAAASERAKAAAAMAVTAHGVAVPADAADVSDAWQPFFVNHQVRLFVFLLPFVNTFLSRYVYSL